MLIAVMATDAPPFMSGAYTILLGALFQSYRTWPVRSFFPAFDASLARMAWEGVNACMDGQSHRT